MNEDRFYHTIINKLNNTIATYQQVAEVSQIGKFFEPLELASYSRDAQINHLLSITNYLLKYVSHCPYLEEIFVNYLKDYIHLANPEMPPFVGELYLDEKFIMRQSLHRLTQKSEALRYRI